MKENRYKQKNMNHGIGDEKQKKKCIHQQRKPAYYTHARAVKYVITSEPAIIDNGQSGHFWSRLCNDVSKNLVLNYIRSCGVIVAVSMPCAFLCEQTAPQQPNLSQLNEWVEKPKIELECEFAFVECTRRRTYKWLCPPNLFTIFDLLMVLWAE